MPNASRNRKSAYRRSSTRRSCRSHHRSLFGQIAITGKKDERGQGAALCVESRRGHHGKKTKKRRSLMHDKFCVLGDNRVWTGSFNFTAEAANANQENVILLENEEIASRYLKEFERLKKEGCQSFDDYVVTKQANG